VCRAFEAFYENPRIAAVYNLGGGRKNSISVLEAITRFEELMGGKLEVEYVDQNRAGDHICYISDLRRLRADYPDWDVTRSLDDILGEIASQRPAA
jgi:CDP-paratose 2-epimerase